MRWIIWVMSVGSVILLSVGGYYFFFKKDVQVSEWCGKDYHENSDTQRIFGTLLLDSHLDLKGNEKILDIGCGDGALSYYLSQKVPAGFVTAIDLSPDMIDFARKKYGTATNISFAISDVRSLPYKQEFDIAISLACLQWVSDLSTAFASIYHALKEQGTFLCWIPMTKGQPIEKAFIETFQSTQWSANFKQYTLPWAPIDLEMLSSLITDAGFEVILKEEIIKTISFPNQLKLEEHFNALPLATHLSATKRRAFTKDFTEKYLTYVPLGSDGVAILEPVFLVVKALKR